MKRSHRPATSLLALGLAIAASGCGVSWSTPVEHEGHMVLSVWGDGPHDVWFAGGSLGGTLPALALHFDGSAWTALDTGSRAATLWWVHGFSASDVWFAGEEGLVMHWDGAHLSTLTTGTRATLYGLWGASPSDLWAVGGEPDVSSVALHYDGQSWSPATGLPQNGGAFFKVWGASASDVFVVGEHGAIQHFDGTRWSRQSSGLDDTVRLLTVRGRPGTSNDVYAVGGLGQGVALHYDGSAWSPVAGLDLSLTPGLTGVSVDAAGDVMIVGLAGTRLRSDGTGADRKWIDESRLEPHQDLHGTWLDAADDIFAVGGNLNAPPGSPREGVIEHFGGGLPAKR